MLHLPHKGPERSPHLKRRATGGTTHPKFERAHFLDPPLPFLQEALTFATFERGMYEIVRTFLPAGELQG
jgi:hypothetical protein